MCHRPNRAARLALLTLCAAVLAPLVAIAAQPDQPSAATTPERATPSTVLFTRYLRHAHYAPMPDGVKLAITVYQPAGGPDVSRFPVLLWYLPGHRESIDPATGTLTSVWSEDDLRYFTTHGYALAVAEMRGSGASQGFRELDRGPQIGRDGKALVDWIAAQPWSDGTVGMVGASYQGFSQYATAAERPAALRAIFPEIAGFDDYTSMFHPGGIQNLALAAFATASIIRDDLNHHDPAGPRPRLPSAPVIDEDGDGELADEIPLDRNGNGDFLDDGEPTYRDGRPRQHVYYLATRDHLRNSNLTNEALGAAPFRDSTLAGTRYDYAAVDPADRAQRIAASGIATYHRGGWFDYHARDTVMWHATLAGRLPTHLMMAPTGHGGFPAGGGEALYRAGPYFQLFGDRLSTNQMLNQEKRLFFDRYLRGVDNGFDRRPPVRLYVMGLGWRDEQAWPLKRQRLTDFNFDAGGGLSIRRTPRGTDRYAVDRTTSSLSQNANRWNYGISSAREPMSLDATRDRRQLYTTAALAADTEVTGHPLLTVTLSANVASGDLFAYLEDVGPDGRALLVTEGQLRLDYPKVLPVQQMVPVPKSVITIRPELPWHGFRARDRVAEPLARDQVQRYTLDLQPTSWVFKTGHRIRISLAGADAPSFALHPTLQDGAGVAPVWTIHRGAGLSKLTLPVIPAAAR